MEKFLFIGGTLALTLVGQLLIKARSLSISSRGNLDRVEFLFAMFSDIWVWSALMAAVAASICWMLALRIAPLSIAYPFMALSFVLAPLGAQVLFGEQVTMSQWTGIALIICGIALGAATAKG